MSISTNVIRVILVDDHHMVRRGVRFCLQPIEDIKLVGEASNGKEALQLCAEVKPDVVIMDLVMPVMGGVDATRIITREYPNIHVIALTGFQDQQQIYDALEAGATSCLEKTVTVGELENAIRKAHLGEATLSTEATLALIKAATQPAEPEFNLTPRELEVLALLGFGFTNPHISNRLLVSRSTVKTHVSSILKKLGAASRTEAVAIAYKHKLIS
jgi:NarL family two-component system response regulator LiaR